ncbi:MAG: hypothetical protein ABI402_11485 [Ferruginibacter sp.]
MIKIIVIIIVAVYIITLIVDIRITSSLNYISILNALTSFPILIYWVNKELRITQHHFEMRETVVLVAECLSGAAALYTILSNNTNAFFNITQYIIYGLHFIALILFGVFVFTFKMTRMF